MHKVAVLMSTYNGEKYLREQIDSILAQKDVDVTLLIRDDGSTDRTIEIIKEYQKVNDNIKLNVGENVGVGNSFMQLVYDSGNEFDYYAFADQDDVWLPEKLKRAVGMLNGEHSPALYCSNQTLVDKDLKGMGVRFQKEPETDYCQVLCKNQLTGCTMVWNQVLEEMLKDEKRHPEPALLRNRIHDVWVAMVASVSGHIEFDMESYILYRQHENNVVGVKKKKIYTGLLEKIQKLLDPGKRNGRSYLAREICKHYVEYVSGKEILEDSAAYRRIRLFRDIKTITRYSGETTFGLAAKILLGLY